MRPITDDDRKQGYIVITTMTAIDDDYPMDYKHLYVFNKELRMWHPTTNGIHLDFVEADCFIFIPWWNIRSYEVQRRSDELVERDLTRFQNAHMVEGKCYVPWGRTFFQNYMKPDETEGPV